MLRLQTKILLSYWKINLMIHERRLKEFRGKRKTSKTEQLAYYLN